MKMKDNPWAVEDITAFLFYNCPECDLKEKDPDTFMGHALQNHKRARISLSGKNHDQENLLGKLVDLSDDDDKMDFISDQEDTDDDHHEALDSQIEITSDENSFEAIEKQFDSCETIKTSNPVVVIPLKIQTMKREFVNMEESDVDQPVTKKLCIDRKSQCYYCGTVLFEEDSNVFINLSIPYIIMRWNFIAYDPYKPKDLAYTRPKKSICSLENLKNMIHFLIDVYEYIPYSLDTIKPLLKRDLTGSPRSNWLVQQKDPHVLWIHRNVNTKKTYRFHYFPTV